MRGKERRFCPTCGEEITQRPRQWTRCEYCYWKGRLESYEPIENLLQRRNELKSREKEVAGLSKQAEAELQNHRAELDRKQPRWKKWLGVTPKSKQLENLGRTVYLLQEEHRDLTNELDRLQNSIVTARHIRTQFKRVSLQRGLYAKLRRNAQERKEVFNANSLSLVRDAGFDHMRFNIRKKDYKRGNPLDNHFRNGIATHVITAFENKCLNCGGSFDLTLDHFVVPKNEGGNFVLSAKSDGSIKLNIVVLCRSCNSAKGELPYVDFFTPEKIAQAIRYQEQLLQFVLNDEVTLRMIKSWYRGV